jgi:RNA-directed DNA polymerase
MNDTRSKVQRQLELTFPDERPGEAGKLAAGGIEPFVAVSEPEHPVKHDLSMETICGEGNFRYAWEHVRSGGKAAGVDGLSIDEAERVFWEQWPELRKQLLEGTYQPQPVRRHEIAKPDGGVRGLGIPTFIDRAIQQAILQRLQPQIDPTFSDSSFGFRPRRSAHQAIEQARRYQADGYRWVVDLDLEKFFDRVNHDILMGLLAKRLTDRRLLRLLRAYLNAGVMIDGLVQPSEEGTPQGGPLSPLLSNVMLDELDRELTRRGHRFVRYADDCNIYVRSERAGHRVMQSVIRFVTKRLKLKVNEQKSAVARPSQRKFLGYSFTSEPQPRLRLAPKAKERFQAKIRELTERTCGRSLDQVVTTLNGYLRGWLGYFGRCETPSVLENLEGWLRHRLRSLVWKQWKTGTNRTKQLRARGIDECTARKLGYSPKGCWPLSASKPLHQALSNKFFESIGLVRLRRA